MMKLNSAIIGCGAISSVHGEALAGCSNANLYAVCDIDPDRARAKGDQYGCKVYTDYLELLSDPILDVVHICTPHYLHAPMAVAAMKAGKHVLVEKPLAISVSDAREMIGVSEQTGKKLGVCFQNRYNTTSMRIREVLDSGKAGRILGGRAFVTWHRDAAYYNSAQWRGTWEKEGGGVLVNQSIHTLDLLQWFMGDVDQVKASVDTRLLEDVIEVEDTAEATIRFKNGSIGLFYATNCYCTDAPVEMELVCEKAHMTLKDDLTIRYADGETEQIGNVDKATGEKAYWGCGHRLLIQDFYSELTGGTGCVPDGRQGIKAVEIIEAIYRSAKIKA